MHMLLKQESPEFVTELLIDVSIFSLPLSFFPKASSFALITDTAVEKLVARRFLNYLKDLKLNVHLISFPVGEAYKTRETKQYIEDIMFRKKMGRDSCILALGGGVVLDIAGFVAATYCRGIPFVSIPTTLLGMVDAGLGGKTGVNTPLGKNLIGTFYPPSSIVMDLYLLETLPEAEWRNGVAECLKHGMIADPALFQLLEKPLKKEKEFLKQMIEKSCLVKKKIIEQDPFEKGKRRILNFGHTIGHALETVEDYQLAHGEAIAIGMIVEAWISVKLGHLSSQDFERIAQSFHTHRFPLAFSPKVTAKKMKETLSFDKKAKEGKARFTLLKEIGEPCHFDGCYCTPIEETILDAALEWMCTQFSKKNGL